MSTVDAKDVTKPVDADKVKQLTAELRAMKVRVNMMETQVMRAPGAETLNALPAAASRANRIQAYDALGEPVLIPGVDSGSAAALAMDLLSPAVGKASAMIAATLRKTGAVTNSVEQNQNAVPNMYQFGAKLDGVTDDWAKYRNAIESGEPRIIVPFGGGTSVITDTIPILNRDSINLDFARGFTLNCVGSHYPGRAGILLSNSNNAEISRVNIRGYRAGFVGDITDAVNSPIDFGIYSTSNGAGAAGNNRFYRCDANFVRDTCFQIGNADTGVIDTATDEHQLIYCSGQFAPNCVTVSQANTNMTRIMGGWMTNYTNAGIRGINNARGIIIDGVMFYTFVGGLYCMFFAKEQSGPVSILNVVTEMYSGTWLTVEGTSSGLSNKNMFTIHGANVTNNDTTVGQKLIDYQGAGSVSLSNSRFGGAASVRAGDAGALLSFRPANAPIGGQGVLRTSAVELYDGADYDVQDSSGTYRMKWINELPAMRAHDVGAGEGDPSPAIIRHTGQINFEVDNLAPITLPAGVKRTSYGKLGGGWNRYTVSYTAFIAAATTADEYFITLPPGTRVHWAYLRTTQAFAGLAGTIRLALKCSSDVLLLDHDVKTAPVKKGFAVADLGTALTTAHAKFAQGAYVPDPDNNTQLALELVSSVGNIGNGALTNLTAGSVDIYVWAEVPPSY